MKKRWIVLLNKAPKGPLTESEVKALLQQGLLRTNDLGYVIDEHNTADHSGWMLLWQFPEFDRRRKTEPGASQKTEPEVERRTPGEEQQIAELKQKALANLPDDLLDIKPEDLIPRSSRVGFSGGTALAEEEKEESFSEQDAPPRSSTAVESWKWLAGALGLGLGALLWNQVDKAAPPSQTAAETYSAVPVNKEPPAINRRPTNAAKSAAPTHRARPKASEEDEAIDSAPSAPSTYPRSVEPPDRSEDVAEEGDKDLSNDEQSGEEEEVREPAAKPRPKKRSAVKKSKPKSEEEFEKEEAENLEEEPPADEGSID